MNWTFLYLARFFLSVKEKNDKENEPDTLKAYQASYIGIWLIKIIGEAS